MTIEHFSIGHNNLVIFYQEGHHYYEKYLDLINHAQKSIHLQTYIFHLDRFGEQVKDALIKASTRGVKVYLVVDSVGSRKLSQEAELELKMAGVQFYRFNGIRLKWLYRWGRRLHHKVLLIDDQQAIVGGINVQYGYQAELSEPQLDFAVYLRGPVISDLSLYCQTLYKKTSKSNFFN